MNSYTVNGKRLEKLREQDLRNEHLTEWVPKNLWVNMLHKPWEESLVQRYKQYLLFPPLFQRSTGYWEEAIVGSNIWLWHKQRSGVISVWILERLGKWLFTDFLKINEKFPNVKWGTDIIWFHNKGSSLHPDTPCSIRWPTTHRIVPPKCRDQSACYNTRPPWIFWCRNSINWDQTKTAGGRAHQQVKVVSVVSPMIWSGKGHKGVGIV